MDNKTKLSPLQEKLLEMLRWFHTFCVDNQLRYYCLGGTMLGAARHQGFIPWDDDIDVGMPRADYQRLSELMMKEQDSWYILETPYSCAKDYCYPISKLYDTTTTLTEKKRQPIKRGIFLDIFPLDGAGDTEAECAAIFAPIKRRYDRYLLTVAGIRAGRSVLKNAAVLAARMIPPFMANNRKMRIALDGRCSEHSFDECKYGGNFLGAWRMKELMPTEIMGQPTEYTFETLTVYGVEHYDAYLTHIYGDWRKLPPKEKQVSHHDFLELNLNKSYLPQK